MTPSQALLSLAQDAWPDPTPPREMGLLLLPALGDWARAIRDGHLPTAEEHAGQLILQLLRYTAQIGGDVDQAIVSGAAAQRVWRETHGLEVT
jgi:hypothetical protein